ncbi:MAG: hypothetical protein GXX84_02795 [Acidobacteria bacterium]|nr:hypothetical protein [Acidobacteriota bacterium]
MGRQAREHRERRKRDHQQNSRINELEEEIKRLAGGSAIISCSDDLPPDIRQSHLEDILKFESIGSGPSLFEGLQQNGVELPHPDNLDDDQAFDRVMEIMQALEEVQVVLIGFDHMTPRQVYSTLWHETLWEGCYVKKRNPEAFTIIDVSHRTSQSEIQKFFRRIAKAVALRT